MMANHHRRLETIQRLLAMTERRQEKSEALGLIEQEEWGQLYQLFQNQPDEVQRPCRAFDRIYLVERQYPTMFHLLCDRDSVPAPLIRLAASIYPQAITMVYRGFHNEATPLQRICRIQDSAEKLRILLRYVENPSESILMCDRNGDSALHYACFYNASLETLQELVKVNPSILQLTTNEGRQAITTLLMSYHSPRFLFVRRILDGEALTTTPHFQEFWRKAEFLALETFRQSPLCPKVVTNDLVLHGLLASGEENVQEKINILDSFHYGNLMHLCLIMRPSLARVLDAAGNLPLHAFVGRQNSRSTNMYNIENLLKAFPEAAKLRNFAGDTPLMIAIRNKLGLRHGLGDLIEAAPEAALMRDRDGNFPLMMAIRSRLPLKDGLNKLFEAAPKVALCRDPATGLYPFQLAATVAGRTAVNTAYTLLLAQPDLALRH